MSARPPQPCPSCGALLAYVFKRSLCPGCGVELRSELTTMLDPAGWQWLALCGSCGKGLKTEDLEYCKQMGITPACEACLGTTNGEH